MMLSNRYMFGLAFDKVFLTGTLKGLKVPVLIKYPSVERAIEEMDLLSKTPIFKTFENTDVIAINIRTVTIEVQE